MLRTSAAINEFTGGCGDVVVRSGGASKFGGFMSEDETSPFGGCMSEDETSKFGGFMSDDETSTTGGCMSDAVIDTYPTMQFF